MSIKGRMLLIAVVVIAAVALAGYRQITRNAVANGSGAIVRNDVNPRLPTFVEIGAKSCVPCVMMTKVMAELRARYGDQLNVVFLDLEVDDSYAEKYDIAIAPTQLLLAADGRELFRHEGFYPIDEIIAQWHILGYPLQAAVDNAGRKATWLESWFTWLNKALVNTLDGSVGLALAAALLWGIMSILLSPCHLSSIPLIVGFIDRQGRATVARATAIATLFALGILITMALLGAITAALGRMAGDIGAPLNYLVAAIFLAVGLYLCGALEITFPGASGVTMRRRGLLAAFILGLLFGIALGPCTFAYMAPVLALAFRSGADHPVYAGALLLLYGLGHCSVIVLAGGGAEYVQRYLNWNEKSGMIDGVKKVCGVLVLLGGGWMVWTA